MQKQTADFKFHAIEDVQKFFPYFCSAVLVDMQPVPRLEASHRHKAQRESRGGLGSSASMKTVGTQIVTWQPPSDPSTVDLLELRGSIFLENGRPSAMGEAVGPIYINHSYDQDREILQDFSENDLITVLYQTAKIGKDKGKPHPEFVYNHETRVFVNCTADLTFPSFDTVQMSGVQAPYHTIKENKVALAALNFLEANELIPKQGNRPRPFVPGEISYYNPPDATGYALGCLRWLFWVAVVVAVIWLFGFIILKM